jgi:hypothetical protein
MAEKYYYPKKEEIRVGWEGEINWNLGYENTYTPITILYPDEEAKDGWNCNIDDVLSLAIWDRCAEIRVPFLSEEQLVAEGWEKLSDLSPFTKKPYKFRKYVNLHFNEPHTWIVHCHGDGSQIKIEHHWASSWNIVDEYIYKGKCPDINTFRYLCNLLGISNATDI